jgi:hypothetical protein
MHTLKNNPDEAERMYLRALKIDPHHVDSICNYAALKHVVCVCVCVCVWQISVTICSQTRGVCMCVCARVSA